MFSDAQVEDSGTYSCSVPVLEETKHVDLFVVCKSHLTFWLLSVYDRIIIK